MDEAQLQEFLGGAPGGPVPQVDSADVKAVWENGKEMQRADPGQSSVTTGEIYEPICKPGANIKAILYRTAKIEMLRTIAPEVMEPLLRDKLDAVFRAAAEIPMEWIGLAAHQGWVFDPDDFIRRVREA